MFWLFFALTVVGILAIAYGLWALSEDSRHRNQVRKYEEDTTAAELLVWMAQNRASGQRKMTIPRKRPVIKSRHSTTL